MAAGQYQPGNIVGGYQILGYLGQGGCAAVFEAARPGEPAVALKIMHAFEPGDVAPQRFAREIALLKRLRHPNVVPLLDFGQGDDEVPYLALELLRGESLKEAIKRQGPFAVERAGNVALQVLDALAAAHAIGIIHRDIKPANIFVCRDAQGGDLVRVLDFGLGKALIGDAPDLQTLTRTGFRVGTPRYMSPEMARGQRAAEPGDLYGVALVMAEMLHGTPLVTAKASIEVMMAHSSADPLPLPAAVTRSTLARVIARGLEKSVERRYHTAMQMRADLEGALGFARAQASVVPLDDEPAPASQNSLEFAPTALFRPPSVPSAALAPASVRVNAPGAGPSSQPVFAGAAATPSGPSAISVRTGHPGLDAPIDPTLVEGPGEWAAAPPRRARKLWWLLAAFVPLVALAVVLGYLLSS